MNSQITSKLAALYSPKSSSYSRQKKIEFYREVAARSSAAKRLEERLTSLVKKATQEVLMTHLKNNELGSMTASACIRDIELFIRYIIYALISGSTSILDDRLLNGLRETYHSLRLPSSCAVSALECIKNSHQLIEDEARLTNEYIDYIIDALV